jgi:hypothetical protein
MILLPLSSMARRLISFISLIGSLTYWLFCNRLTTAINEATEITWRLKQAAALGVPPCDQALPKLQPQLIISPPHCFTCIRSWGRRCGGGSLLLGKRCGCGLPLLANPTTVTCYKMQIKYFLSVFHKWRNTTSWGSVRISTHGYL